MLLNKSFNSAFWYCGLAGLKLTEARPSGAPWVIRTKLRWDLYIYLLVGRARLKSMNSHVGFALWYSSHCVAPAVSTWVSASSYPPFDSQMQLKGTSQKSLSIPNDGDHVWLYFVPANANPLVLAECSEKQVGSSRRLKIHQRILFEKGPVYLTFSDDEMQSQEDEIFGHRQPLDSYFSCYKVWS